MTNRIAFLLLFLVLLAAAASATAPVVAPGESYSGVRNTNIDLNGSATDSNGTITNIAWAMPVGSGCTIVNEFVYVSGDQSIDNAVITCTDVNSAIEVALTANNNYGESTTETAQLTISNQAPTAVLAADTTAGKPPVAVDFNGSCADADGNGTIATCFLDYGDGNGEAIAGPPYIFSKSHTYYAGGSYTAKLMANDDQDVNGEATVTIQADNAPPATTASGVPSGWSNSDASITLSCSDSGTGCKETAYRRDSDGGSNVTMGDWTDYSGAISFSSDGNFALDFNSRDDFGNTEEIHRVIVQIDKSIPTTSVSTSVSNDDVTVSWGTVTDNWSGLNCYYVYRSTSNGFSITDGGVTTVSSCTGNTSVGDNDLGNDTYYYRVKTVDHAGNESVSGQASATVDYGGGDDDDDCDNTEPVMDWEEPGTDSTVSGVVEIKVRAYDDETGIKFVTFYVDNVVIETDSTSRAERYSIDWNSETVADGRHTFKAIAMNRSCDTENDTQVMTRSVTTDNGIVSVAGQEDASAALEEAESASRNIDVLVENMDNFCIEASDAVVDLIEDAEKLLADANKLLEDGDIEEAKEKAEDAKEKFDEAAATFSISNYGTTQAYVFNEEQVGLFFQGVGMGAELVGEAEGLLEDFMVNRAFVRKKVEDGDDTYYKAIIRITVKNDAQEGKIVQLVEAVPKAFADDAGKLVASEAFTVVVADPVVKWYLELAPGEQREINYALKANLSKGEVDALAASEPMQSFISPPIVLAGSTSVSAASFSSAAISGPAGLFALGDALNWIAWIVGVVIVVAIAFFLFSYVQGRKEKQPFGLGSVGGKPGLMDRFGRGLSGLGKGREEGHRPRWAYKE